MASIRIAAPALLLLLAGCVSGPDYKAPEISLPGKYAEGGAKSVDDVSSVAWWTAFGDRKLNAYVDAGLDQNLDVQQALERINSATSNVTVAGAGALPSLIAGAANTTSGQAGNLRTQFDTENSTSGQASLSWLLDFFGEFRRSKESALASLDAANALADASKLAFISDLAISYINARAFQERIALSNSDLKSRRETLQLTQFQLEAGAASRLDVVQAEGLVDTTLAEIPALETSFRTSVHHMATLLGLPAPALLGEMLKGSPQPVARVPFNAGIPADVIRNRPDVRAAERQLAAATAQIGVAEAQLYPSISLSGNITPSVIHSSNNGGLTTWSFGPTLSLPILDGGLLGANVQIAQSNARGQYLAWKQTVLVAIEQVQNALAALRRDGQTVDALRASVKSAQEALELSTASYKDGASSLLDVLDAQRSVSDAQASLAQAIGQTATDYVNLNIAIGGGYNPAKPAVVSKKLTN